jgi:ABC-2 type transport system permease protein
MFSNSAQIDITSFGFSFSSAVVPVAPGFTKTRAWFVGNGLAAYLSSGVDATLIEELAWLFDNPYASVINAAAVQPTSRFFIGFRSEVPGRFWAAPDFGIPEVTRDGAEIAELAPRLRTACFMGGGYLVQAKLRGVDVWVYYYLPADEAPGFMGGTGDMGGSGSSDAGGTGGTGSSGADGTSGTGGDSGGAGGTGMERGG